MRDDSIDDVRGRLTGLVRAILAENEIERAFSAEDRLVEIGLTSLDMVTLMLKVEAEFDVEIPQADITPDNFSSVASVERLVARIAGDAPNGG